MPQVFNAPEEELSAIIPIEYVEEENDAENEAQVDHYLFEEGNYVESEKVDEDEQHIPVGNVFFPPPHMTKLCLNAG